MAGLGMVNSLMQDSNDHIICTRERLPKFEGRTNQAEENLPEKEDLKMQNKEDFLQRRR